MKASLIGKEGNIANFEIAFSAEEFEDALIEAYKKNKGEFRIDGFRPGKAPRKLIEKHYGENIFDEEAVEALFAREYPNALLALDLEPIDRPEADLPELKHGEGFTVKFSVPVPPEAEVKDYEGVEVQTVEYEVTDKDIDDQLEQAQTRGARWVAQEGPAEDGDMLDIDYSGFLDGVKFDGGTGEGQSLTLGSGAFIPGFEEQLIGKKAGEETDVNVTFPEEYHAEELAGKAAVFHVKVNEVKREEKPELNDEFAQDISEFDTLDELKADIRRALEEQAEQRAEGEMKDAILEKICEANDIEVPDIMVEDRLEEMLKEFERNIKQQGFKLEQFFQMTGQAPNELRERIKQDAYRQVKMRLIVNNIARQEGFTASDEEVEKELASMAEMYGMEADKMHDVLGPFQLKMLAGDIVSKKVVDHVYENAVGVEAPPAEAETAETKEKE
ncbi:MAG: trigger factor [Clostridiales Family XIII bacterium]|jgi:trigger factor|nr:trigger factor [Clostridiales Family XIII bacterium]